MLGFLELLLFMKSVYVLVCTCVFMGVCMYVCVRTCVPEAINN